MTRNEIVFVSEMVTSAAAPRRLYRSASDGLDSTRPTRLDVGGVSKGSRSTAGKIDSENGGKIHVRDAWTEQEKACAGQGGGVSVGGDNSIVLESKLIVELWQVQKSAPKITSYAKFLTIYV